MGFDTESLFSKIQKRQEQEATNNSSSLNSMVLKLKINSSYALRLLWLPPYGNCKREYPMIEQYTHHYWDNNAAAGERNNTVYCPTSQYIKGETRAGFDACPICTECQKLYQKSSESSSAKNLYNTFKRIFAGYVPVYVVNGPEDVIGQVRILKYSKQFKKHFDRFIFGRTPKSNEDAPPINPDEVIGLEAFIYEKDNTVITEGYNLNVQVGSRRIASNDGKSVEMPDYNIAFSHRKTNITDFNGEEITLEKFNKLNEELSYDNTFYRESTAAELTKFAMKFLSVDESNSTITESTSDTPTITNPYSNTPVESNIDTSIQENKTPEETKSDDIDLDKLIDDL